MGDNFPLAYHLSELLTKQKSDTHYPKYHIFLNKISQQDINPVSFQSNKLTMYSFGRYRVSLRNRGQILIIKTFLSTQETVVFYHEIVPSIHLQNIKL